MRGIKARAVQAVAHRHGITITARIFPASATSPAVMRWTLTGGSWFMRRVLAEKLGAHRFDDYTPPASGTLYAYRDLT